MSIKPYVPDIDAWVAHFKNRDNFKEKKTFYEVKPLTKIPKSEPPVVQVKMVTPVAQAVEQAKAQLIEEKKKKKTRKRSFPWDKNV